MLTRQAAWEAQGRGRMNSVADSITRALGVDQDPEEEEMHLPLRQEDYSGDESGMGLGASKRGLRQNSLGFASKQPNKVISFCLLIVFLGIGLLVFVMSARMAIQPDTATIGDRQIQDIEHNIRKDANPLVLLHGARDNFCVLCGIPFFANI